MTRRMFPFSLAAAMGRSNPQRRLNATIAPFSITSGDINKDGHTDLIVVDALPGDVPNQMAILLGRGDGTFEEQKLIQLRDILPEGTPALADLNRDGNLDLVLGGGITNGLDIYLGDGKGNFNFLGNFPGTRQAADLVITDVDGDGNLDVVGTSLSGENSIYLVRGRGDGSFYSPQTFFAGQSPLSVKLVDWGSPVEQDDGTVTLGPRDGKLDLVVADSGVVTAIGQSIAPEIVVLPGLYAEDGTFQGFGTPIKISSAVKPLDLKVSDFNRDGVPDLGIVDLDEFFVIFGRAPAILANDFQASARDLGTVVHFVQPTLTITPQQPDAWYHFTVPTEAVSGSLDEVLAISGGFVHPEGAGLAMEVLDRQGNILGTGEQMQIRVHQGATLFIHILGVAGSGGQRGSGDYTLDIAVLPQLIAVQGISVLPSASGGAAGATSSLVLTFQGDRLNATAAQDPANYLVTWLGPDGRLGTADDRVIPIGARRCTGGGL